MAASGTLPFYDVDLAAFRPILRNNACDYLGHLSSTWKLAMAPLMQVVAVARFPGPDQYPRYVPARPELSVRPTLLYSAAGMTGVPGKVKNQRHVHKSKRNLRYEAVPPGRVDARVAAPFFEAAVHELAGIPEAAAALTEIVRPLLDKEATLAIVRTPMLFDAKTPLPSGARDYVRHRVSVKAAESTADLVVQLFIEGRYSDNPSTIAVNALACAHDYLGAHARERESRQTALRALLNERYGSTEAGVGDAAKLLSLCNSSSPAAGKPMGDERSGPTQTEQSFDGLVL